MSEIEWTDATWNPMVGCSKVSPGCRECYAETWAAQMVLRLRGLVAKGAASERTLSTLAAYERVVAMDDAGNPLPRWSGEVGLIPHKLAEPLSWRKPRMVFVNSMSDLFHESVPFEYVDAVFGVMAACPQHTFQVLTKRPERAAEFFAWADRVVRGRVAAGEDHAGARSNFLHSCVWGAGVRGFESAWVEDMALPNVWLGVSVENQAQADARIPQLLRLPAAVRFVSAEPLLGPVDLRPWLGDPPCERCEEGGCVNDVCPYDLAVFEDGPYDLRDESTCWTKALALDWVIVGGESGKGARPCDVDWIRGVVRQCSEAGVPCFVKQLGSRAGSMVPTGKVRGKVGTADRAFEFRFERGVSWQTCATCQGTGRLHAPPNGVAPCSCRSDRSCPPGYRNELANLRHPKGGDPSEWPEDLRVREWPASDGAPA